MKPITIISGPVGAGKTAVSKLLCETSPVPSACIEGDKFWSFIVKDNPNQNPNKNFGMIMASMILAAIPYALADYETIIDFSTPPWFLDTARRLVKKKGIPLDYVIIRPSEHVCALRAASRADGTIEDYSHYHDLYKSFDNHQQITITDDNADLAEVVKLIQSGLAKKQFRLDL